MRSSSLTNVSCALVLEVPVVDRIRPMLEDMTVEITNYCPLRCQACGIGRETSRHEITALRFIGILENVLAGGPILFVSVTGGEPFLHPEIVGIIQYLGSLRSAGRIGGWGIYTNGTCTGRIRNVLARVGDLGMGVEIGISIDGTEQTHDFLRGRGTYGKTLATMEFLSCSVGRSVNLNVKFTLNQKNYDEMAAVYQLARKFGARFSPKLMEHDVRAYYHRKVMTEVNDLARVTKEMVTSVRRQAAGILTLGGVNPRMLRAVTRLLVSGKKGIRACCTPLRSLFVTSQGEVYPCLYMASAGRIGRQGELPEGLTGVQEDQSRLAMAGQCPRCFAYHGFLKSYNLQYLD